MIGSLLTSARDLDIISAITRQACDLEKVSIANQALPNN